LTIRRAALSFIRWQQRVPLAQRQHRERLPGRDSPFPGSVVLDGRVLEDRAEVRRRLVRILQDAHAGELAAAYAYRGHARSLRDGVQQAEVSRIEAAEWHHRAEVARLLVELGARPRRPRELLMGAVGRFFGGLCFVGGWFAPMYAAGRLEAMNVVQYVDARDAAGQLGLASAAERLDVMRVEEVRHEHWFGDQIRGHRLLRPTSRLFGWTPPPPLTTTGADAARAIGS
jgi:demethoxyubiquinone hydroxylase (CLK1/Coq7/Cat5 family)